MEDYQENNTLVTANCEQQASDKNITCWQDNSFEGNFQVKNDSQNETNMETYNSYECEVNDRQFNMKRNCSNPTEIEENNDCVNLMDSNVNGVYEMGRDFLELNQDINQKQNDIQLLQENCKLVKEELSDKRKLFQKLKLDLITEQDNYDDFQKKLDDEVELIASIGLQQGALSDLTKNLCEQQFRVEKLLENFNTEFSSTKINGEKLLNMFEKNRNLLKTEKQSFARKEEIDNNRTVFLKEKQQIEEILKIKINELKHRYENLKVKYYKQIAVLDYLKLKEDEELSKCAEFKSELKFTEENGHQQIDIEENLYLTLEKKEKNINSELQGLKQKIVSEKALLEELENHKKELENEIENLQKQATAYLLDLENLNKFQSEIATETNQLNQRLSTKTLVKEKNYELHQYYQTLTERRNYIVKETNGIDNLIIETNKKCEDLEINLQEVYKEQQMGKVSKDAFDSKRIDLMKTFEERKEQNKNRIDYLENQMSDCSTEREVLERKITQCKHEIESHIQTSDNQSLEILKNKELLQENNERGNLLHNEIKKMSSLINSMQKQFEVNLFSLKSKIQEKEIVKADEEAKIKHRIELQSEIEYLIGELSVIDCQQKDDLKKMKEKYSSELQLKQEYVENKRNELELLFKEKKKKVSDLQEDIVDEQKNELHLIKEIQKLAFVHGRNKRELLTLKNVIKTLDEKLNTIAQAVTTSLKDKESVIQSQSTVLTTGMGPSNANKSNAKRKTCNYDSSSSGISMHDNDTTWKKKLLMKQQLKQQKVHSQQSTSTQLITSDTMNVAPPATTELKDVTPKRKQSEPQNKSSRKPIPKNTPKSKSKTPTKKSKK